LVKDLYYQFQLLIETDYPSILYLSQNKGSKGTENSPNLNDADLTVALIRMAIKLSVLFFENIPYKPTNMQS
jgi:hypothetical protein